MITSVLGGAILARPSMVHFRGGGAAADLI
jgi:hypothetical protein